MVIVSFTHGAEAQGSPPPKIMCYLTGLVEGGATHLRIVSWILCVLIL